MIPLPRPRSSDIPSLLRWAGSKRRLAPEICERAISALDSRGRYFEPFLGSAAVFLRLRAMGCYAPAILSDAIPALIETYRAVRAAPEAVREELELLQLWEAAEVDQRSFYLRLRRRFNKMREEGFYPPAYAAALLYLNRRCFNGLYRTNRAGGMNTPWGGPRTTPPPSVALLQAVAGALHGADLRWSDFEESIATAGSGDVIYADPPYAGTFDGYAACAFNEADQRRLMVALREAWCRGATVIASNSDHPLVWELYGREPFHIECHELSHDLGATKARRRKVRELLIIAERRR